MRYVVTMDTDLLRRGESGPGVLIEDTLTGEITKCEEATWNGLTAVVFDPSMERQNGARAWVTTRERPTILV